jgi:hypothetical protein
VIRAAHLLVLVLALLLQGLMPGRSLAAPAASGDAGHAALHWQQQGHHHHDDGSAHLDDSADSARHLAADQLPTPLVAAAAERLALPHPGGSAPLACADSGLPSPFLEGPLRPPRATA